MSRKEILVVEDEEDIREIISHNLRREGFSVSAASSGEDALKQISRKLPDLVLLDLMLPGIDGLEVCRRLKRDSGIQHIPVVMVTAKGEESDIVAGLELGADDYVTKPFKIKVLIARVRAVLRRRDRNADDQDQPVKIHDIVMDPARHEVLIKGKTVDLTASEFKMLHLLAGNPGRVFTRDQIVDRVHGADYAVTDRAVDVQIVGLRKKLGNRADDIETVRGVGYRFRE